MASSWHGWPEHNRRTVERLNNGPLLTLTYLQTVQGHNACNDGERQTQPHCIPKNSVLEARFIHYHNQCSHFEQLDSRVTRLSHSRSKGPTPIRNERKYPA